MTRHATLLFLSSFCCFALGCDDAPARQVVPITTELYQEWDMLPHRISAWEITSAFNGDETLTVTAQNNGGAAGLFDAADGRVGLDVWRATNLASVEGSVLVEIGPSGSVDPETHTAMVMHTQSAPELAGAETVVAFIRGYRIDTDLFTTPPAFAATYDPALGYTTQGIGIQLGAPTVSGDDVSFSVSVRNSLGEGDRPDLDSVIPLATTWMRVDYTLVGAFGDAARSTGEVGYTLSTATYGMNTAHPHADDATQAVSVAGQAGLRHGLMGLTGFDFWVNIAGRIDPGCTVIQDANNLEGQPGVGPGRYVTDMSVRLWDTDYDGGTGTGSGRVDMLFSNSSTLKEIGNVCLGVRGEVGLLQFDGGSASRTQLDSGVLEQRRSALVEGTIEIP